jgi:hypothetical protein
VEGAAVSGRGKRSPKAKAAAKPARPAPPARRTFADRWNAFFFAERDPRLASVIRIGYAVLLLINVVAWAPDLERWFGESGVLPFAKAQQIVDEDAVTIFAWLPKTDAVLWTCYGLLVTNAVLLLVGWHTRVQAICVFVWLVSFQHRNIAIVDGEDTVFRLFAFFLALSPAGWAFSLDARRRRRREAATGVVEPVPVPWALRLFQLEISLIYLSSAIEKSFGTDWTSGKALYYVARLDDTFGKWPVPAFPFESLAIVKVMTWAVLALEWTLPFLLWGRRTRRPALVAAVLLHLSIEYTMNLFLFHWIMLLGLVSFTEYGELRWPWKRQGAGGAAGPAGPAGEDALAPTNT